MSVSIGTADCRGVVRPSHALDAASTSTIIGCPYQHSVREGTASVVVGTSRGRALLKAARRSG